MEESLVETPPPIGMRPVDPGTLYNLGNVLGFVAGLAVALSFESPGVQNSGLWDRAVVHLWEARRRSP